MKRKIVQHGTNTLTISLPSRWAKENNLKKGDELELSENDDGLMISGKGKAEKQEISIDVTKLATTSLLTYTLLDLFMKGYKKIRIKYEPKIKASDTLQRKQLFDTIVVIKSLSKYLIGSEITEDKPGMCVLEEITFPDPSTFNNAFRRGFLLLLENAEYIEKTKPKEIAKLYEFEQIYLVRFYNPDKFFQYSIKLLKEVAMPKSEKERYLLLINNLKMVGHLYALIGEMKKQLKISQESVTKVNNILRAFYDQVFNPNITKINELANSINSVQFWLMSKKTQDIMLTHIVTLLKNSLIYLPLEELVRMH